MARNGLRVDAPEEIERFMREETCSECGGKRLKKEAMAAKINGKNIGEFSLLPINELFQLVGEIKNELKKSELKAFSSLFAEILKRIKFLLDVGLDYLSLEREASTLSGGEAQRIKLATELAKKETHHTLYILDEPTTGLHFEDIRKLLAVLKTLVEKENTVIIIEHNLDVLKNCDHIIDLGPEGGEKGGEVVAEGTPEEIIKNKKSYTGHYLRNSAQSA